MLHRIRLAAVDVCGGPDGRNSDEILRFNDCHQQAVARAVAGLNAPQVTAAYRAGPDQTAWLSHWLR